VQFSFPSWTQTFIFRVLQCNWIPSVFLGILYIYLHHKQATKTRHVHAVKNFLSIKYMVVSLEVRYKDGWLQQTVL
jgi:hypothetical protein